MNSKSPEKMDFKQAVVFDYTGSGEGNVGVSQFGADVIKRLREPSRAGANRIVIVLDTAYGLNGLTGLNDDASSPHLVRDHINLSGINPLIGPNDPCGERFPVVNDIYVHDCPELGSLKSLVAAGVKPDQSVDSETLELINQLGAQCYTFNLIPTMLIAAHAGWKVLAIVGPEGKGWQKGCLEQLTCRN